ncbi:metal ABC transporter ATP-binding protein [soil metagenome]
MVSVKKLSAGYGPTPVIEDVTFTADPGQRIAVLGPNGGGKTTLFRVLLGEMKPLGGELSMEGRPAIVAQTDRSRLDFPVSALAVAVMGTLDSMPWWRPPGRTERSRALGALSEVGMADRRGIRFGELSGGQRQRVLIARALVQEASVLLLDEPFSGLDAPSSEALMRLIDRLAGGGRTILIATHDLDQALGWDRVLCLNRRQIAFGEPSATLDRPTLEATYGGEIVELPGDAEAGVLPPHHHDHDHDHDHG